MLLYFTVMATVNLCAGYALGVWLGSPFGAPPSTHDDLPPLPKVTKASKSKAMLHADTPLEDAPPQAAEIEAEEVAYVATEPLAPFDPLRTLAELETLVGELFEHCGEATPDAPALVAAIRLDPLTDVEPSSNALQRILDKLPALWGDQIDPSNVSADAATGQLLCNFPGDRLDQMTQRIEYIRQLVEAAEFVVDGAPVQATVSCAIAETTESKTPAEMLNLLEEAFHERDRLGANRTYHHDGAFPTPLPPADVKVERQTVLV